MKRDIYISLCLAGCLCLGLLTGCSDSQVNYVEEDTENVTEQGISGLEQFADADKWEDEWIVTDKEGNTVDIHVSAKISIPDADSMSVVEVKNPKPDAAYKEKLLKAIFGDTEIYYDNSSEKTDDDLVPVTDYEGDSYIGIRDEISYHLEFSQDDTRVMISLYPVDPVLLAPEELEETGGFAYKETANASSNTCALSEEEAVDLAKSFLEEGGFENQTCVKAYSLSWGGGEEIDEATYYNYKEVADGYALYFKQETEDAAVTAALFSNAITANAVEWRDNQLVRNLSAPHTVLYVNDFGVILMDIINPYEITTLAENVELLPLETIQRIIKNELLENGEDYYIWENSSHSYNSMELVYCMIMDDTNEGYYSYIPVWKLSDGKLVNSTIYINAIDGSVIPFENLLSL